MSKITNISLGYVLSLVLLSVAIFTSYSIVQNIIGSKRVLHRTESLVNNIQISIHDSVSVMGDFWTESRKPQPDVRTLQLVKRRAMASMQTLSGQLNALQNMRPALRSTSSWEEIQWVVDDSEGSVNHKLAGYLAKSNFALSSDALVTPQLPIEAAGAYNGSIMAGYQKSAGVLREILDKKSIELKNVHKILTAAIIIVMVLLSAVVIAPLWRKLVREHKRVQQAQVDLRRIAYTDRETGLPNLNGLEHQLAHSPGFAEGGDFHLLLVRITNLDELYGLIGSHQADTLARSISRRLKGWGNEELGWCRSGEAEFCCVVSDARSRLSREWGQAFHRNLTGRLAIGGILVRPDVSVATSSMGSAASQSDVSLWEHQSNARLASLSFEPAAGFIPEYSVCLRLALTEKNNLINQISEGINKRQFIPYYQLKVDAQTGDISSVEVLARWNLPDGSIVSPGVFIPVAESAGLITSLTYSLFEQVANDVNRWCAIGYRVGRLAINIAGEVLQHEELYNQLSVMNASLPTQCEGLEVEITENIVLGESTSDINSILENIRAMGIHVAIDDFGTGYASLQTLIDIPIDVLKIDRSFVLPMTESGSGSEVVSAMISLSKKLNKRCVVEGVETAWQWQQLAELGADELQGFYFYKPACGADIEISLRNCLNLKLTA